VPCLSANGTGCTNYKQEHELLFGRGKEGKIIHIDYKNYEVTVLIEE
jgi:hypothetical protein